MPDNDDAGRAGTQPNAGPGGRQAPVANDDAPSDQQDVTTDVGSDEDDDAGLDDKGKQLLAKYRREAQNLRKSLKSLEPAAKRLKEIEDRDKGEAEKLKEQIGSLNKEIADLRIREVRAAAAVAAGLPAHMASFITADDPDEAKDQAKALVAWGKGAGSAGPDLRQGARPNTQSKLTGDQFLRRMAGRDQ